MWCWAEGWRDTCHCSFVGPFPGRSADRRHLACVEPTPHMADSEAALAGEISPPRPVSPWDPAPLNPQISHGWALCPIAGPTLCLLQATDSLLAMNLGLPDPGVSCTFWGRHLLADHWYQHEPQYLLDRFWGSVGPTQIAACLTVIYHFCGSPWTQHWQQF